MRVLIYTLPALLLFLALEWRLAQLPTLYSLRAEKLESRAKELEILVLGGCDAQAAIKPSLFSKRGLNLASANQSWVISSQIYFAWADRLPKLKKVILSTSYFAWQASLREGPEYWRNYFYTRFMGLRGELNLFSFFDVRQFSLFFLYWPYSRSLVFEIGIPTSQIYEPLSGERLPLLPSLPDDGYLPYPQREERYRSPDRLALIARSMESEMRPSYFENNEYAVRSLLLHAKQRSIDILFIRTPGVAGFESHMNQEQNQAEKRLIDKLCGEYGCKLRDYRTTKELNFSDFADATHLNESGAIKFTRLLGE